MNNPPVVLITGALTGIGRTTALAFAREGTPHRRQRPPRRGGQASAAELRALGAEAEFVRADVRFEAEVRNLVEQTVERFGRIDVAVNNAGTEGQPGPITEQTAANYEATFATNVLGTLLVGQARDARDARAGLGLDHQSLVDRGPGRHRRAHRSMRPASTRSKASPRAPRSKAPPPACASTRWRPGPSPPTCSSASSAATKRPRRASLRRSPARRAATPEEIAQTIVFLASDKARYLTGQRIAVDGGYTAQ